MAERGHGASAPPTETTIRSREWEFRDPDQAMTVAAMFGFDVRPG